MSNVTSAALQLLIRRVQDTYRRYPLPWVVGYSGGKDSTATLQLVWMALSQMEPEELDKPVFVLSSNTGVENPMIEDRIGGSVDRINGAAAQSRLPIHGQAARKQSLGTNGKGVWGRLHAFSRRRRTSA